MVAMMMMMMAVMTNAIFALALVFNCASSSGVRFIIEEALFSFAFFLRIASVCRCTLPG